MDAKKIYEYIETKGYPLYNTYTPGHKEFYVTLNHLNTHKETIILRPEINKFITFEKIPGEFGFELKRHDLTINNLNKIIKLKQAQLIERVNITTA